MLIKALFLKMKYHKAIKNKQEVKSHDSTHYQV